MKKYLFLASLFVLPMFAFASVSLDVSVTDGNATVSGNTTGGATTEVSVDNTNILSTASASWSDARSYEAGSHNVVANASDGSSASASFTIGSGGGADPMNFPCGGTKGSCYESVASGEVIQEKYGENGCNFFMGCITSVPKELQKPKYEHLKYGEQGCNFFMGCKREL